MLDSDDCTLSLDNLFFDKPIVHKVKPLHQEANPWLLDVPPSLSQIPATQDMQKEAESLSKLYTFSQKPRKFLPPFKGSAALEVSPSKHSSPYGYHNDEREKESHGGGGGGGGSSSNASRCDSLWGGEGFRDYPEASSQMGRGGDETPQDSGHRDVGQGCLSLDRSKSPPFLRRSLFKAPVWNDGGDLSKADDLSRTSIVQHQQTASRPPTYLGRVTMATGPRPTPPPPEPPSSAPSLPPPRQPAQTQDAGTKRALVPPMTPQPLHIQGSSGSGVLRPVSEIPAKFRSVFGDFPFFNYVQSKALDDVLYTGKNFVACAPTGSGKTVLFELAIIRMLMETTEPWTDVKAVYMAPIKALCSQCFENWKKKFGPLGLICKELTGDTEIDDFFEIQDSHIILTTPEKWDSMTRKWKDNCLLQLVRLFLIDEVHVVRDATRGATLEVVVSRMKAVHAYRTAQNPEAGLSMRFVAVSATIPNTSDIADWLSNESGPASYLHMDESHRPVKLRKVVLGFPCNQNQTEFKFDLSLNYRMANIIQTYADHKPALVFCSTRKGVQQAATVLAKDARFMMTIEHKQRLMKHANSLLDSKLRDLVMLGVGYHHAGVDVSDRRLIESAFTMGDLPVLFTTRTLAMGVNLPAHLVVIKSTTQYVAGSCEEYSEADLLQMTGRAGRPQFDTSATAVIMTKNQTKDKYLSLMNGMEIIESSLHSNLVEHLNAEIALQTISDVNMALDWIRSTLLYIRALKNPTHYGFSADLDRNGIEAKLQELCLKDLNSLVSFGLIDMDEDINIKPTEAGKLMARYCVAFDTMKKFSRVSGTENLSDMIDLVSKSREFCDIQLRVTEKRPLNTLNKDKNRITIRYPMEGKIRNSEMKVNCLIQAQLGSILIPEFGLTQETGRIFRNGMRISKCLSEYLSLPSQTGFSAVLTSLIVAKCFRAKLWENSPYVSKQLEKIGQSLSTAMVNAGLTTFSKIEQINARELELIVNRHPPFGNQIREAVIHLPKYEVTVEQLPRYSGGVAEVVVKVNLKNQEQLLVKRTAPDHHYVSLVIGNADNAVVHVQKLTDILLLKCGTWSKKIEVSKASKGDEISVNLISSEYGKPWRNIGIAVGLDIQQSFNVFFSGARKFGADSKQYNLAYDHPGQNPPMRAQSTDQTATQRDYDPSATDQDIGNKRECNHFCKNKELCAHECCKIGVSVPRKRTANQESGFSSYLKDLRSRCDTLAPTPVKRLKMKMIEEAVSANMQEYHYKPKEKLPPVSRYGGYEGAVDRHVETVDLTQDACAPQQDIVLLDNYDGEYDDFVEDMHTMMEEPAQTPAGSHAYHQSSSMWMKPGVSVSVSQHVSQIKTTDKAYSNRSTTGSKQATHYENASSSLIPTVSFDLGNEWDDWGDFDDENLVHASETSSATTHVKPQVKPQVQRPMDHNMPARGFAASSAPVLPRQPQFKPSTTTARPPLRAISPTLTPEFRKPGPSPLAVQPQSRVTLDWNKKVKIPSIFSEEIPVVTPETLPQQTKTPVAPIHNRFAFFAAMSGPTSTGSSFNESTSSKEEEAFVGIFDGLF